MPPDSLYTIFSLEGRIVYVFKSGFLTISPAAEGLDILT